MITSVRKIVFPGKGEAGYGEAHVKGQTELNSVILAHRCSAFLCKFHNNLQEATNREKIIGRVFSASFNT